MQGVATLLACAALAYGAARLLRVPGIPLLLLGGVALAALAPPPQGVLEDALLLGVSFLLFVVGLELDPGRTRAQRGAALRVGVVQFAVLAVLGFAASRALGFDAVEAAYLALALTASSTLVGVRLLQRRGQMFEPFGRLVLGVLLLQDVLVILLIPLVTDLGRGWGGAATGLAAIALLGGLSLGVRRWGGPLLLRIGSDPEAVLLGALAVLFAFLGISALLEVPIVVGAFLAGVSLSRFPVRGVVRTELQPIGDFFSALFFTALGAVVGLPDPGQLGQAAILALLLLVVTTPLVTVIAERTGMPAKPSIESGLLLSQTSELSLVIGLIGMLQGVIGAEVFTVIAVLTTGTMLLTPIIATDAAARALARLHPGRKVPAGPPPAGHVLLVGVGSTGMPILEDLVVAGIEVVVIDDDPAVIEQVSGAGVVALRGDATDPAVLRRAGADRARIVSSTIRRPRDNEALLRVAAGVPVLVRVFDVEDARWIEERGGTPVLYSEATADGLMEWFRGEREFLEDSLRRRIGAVRDPAGR